MKRRILFVLLAMLVGMTLIISSCGSSGGGSAGGSEAEEPMTLEKYVEGDQSVEEAIDNAMNDSNVLVEIKGNEIIYSFDLSTMDGYTEELAKTDEIKAALMSALESAGGTFGGIAKSIEDATEIAGITATVNYTWGDEIIATKTFTSADASAETTSE